MQTVPADWPKYPYYQGCLGAQADDVDIYMSFVASAAPIG